jgi:hypothetical protein
VNFDHGVPFRFHHVDQHAVAENAGVVHQHVERAVGVDRLVDQSLRAPEIGDVVGVHHRLATTLLNRAHDFLRGGLVGADAVVAGAEIIDHDLGTMGGEGQCVLAADAPPGAGDDGDASAAKKTHVAFPSYLPPGCAGRWIEFRISCPCGSTCADVVSPRIDIRSLSRARQAGC